MIFDILSRNKNRAEVPQFVPTAPVQFIAPCQVDERRPCLVRGRKAIFHRWVNSAKPVLPKGVELSENARYYQFRITQALVEYEDGTVERVYPDVVQFTDGGGFDKYTWTDKERDNDG